METVESIVEEAAKRHGAALLVSRGRMGSQEAGKSGKFFGRPSAGISPRRGENGGNDLGPRSAGISPQRGENGGNDLGPRSAGISPQRGENGGNDLGPRSAGISRSQDPPPPEAAPPPFPVFPASCAIPDSGKPGSLIGGTCGRIAINLPNLAKLVSLLHDFRKIAATTLDLRIEHAEALPSEPIDRVDAVARTITMGPDVAFCLVSPPDADPAEPLRWAWEYAKRIRQAAASLEKERAPIPSGGTSGGSGAPAFIALTSTSKPPRPN